MAAELANMAGLTSVTVKNVSFDQLVAGRTNDFDLALAEISITPERAKVVDFSKPYFDSNIGVLVQKGAGRHRGQHHLEDAARRTPARPRSPFIQDQLKCATPRSTPTRRRSTRACCPARSTPTSSTPRSCSPRPRQTGGKLEVVGQYKTGEKYGAIYPKGSANEDALEPGHRRPC